MKKLLKLAILIPIIAMTFNSCAQKKEVKQITFIELGSVKCKPCIKMQEVIKKVEAKYPKKVKTIFYDVWTKEDEHYADEYHIGQIPTQVFLDKNGKEYFRHVGYFEFEELEKILIKGLND